VDEVGVGIVSIVALALIQNQLFTHYAVQNEYLIGVLRTVLVLLVPKGMYALWGFVD